jgi:hypothetical protein
MKEGTTMGMNRTGLGTAPLQAKQMEENTFATAHDVDVVPGIRQSASEIRMEYAEQSEPVGTIPPPTSLKGAAKTAVAAVTGTNAAAFIDALGERLAFERTGTRLWETLLTKMQANGVDQPLTVEEAVRFCDEERGHAEMLRSAIETLGADPTVQTPGADVVGVASLGLLQVVSDPRMSLQQTLQAVLIAELTDTESWDLLRRMAAGLGYDDLVPRFEEAARAEAEHLAAVRRAVAALRFSEAGVSPSDAPPAV